MPAQDIYSLAATMWECLAGEPPFCRGDIRHQIEHGTPPMPWPGSAAMQAVLASGLARTPDLRAASAGGLLGGEDELPAQGREDGRRRASATAAPSSDVPGESEQLELEVRARVRAVESDVEAWIESDPILGEVMQEVQDLRELTQEYRRAGDSSSVVRTQRMILERLEGVERAIRLLAWIEENIRRLERVREASSRTWFHAELEESIAGWATRLTEIREAIDPRNIDVTEETLALDDPFIDRFLGNASSRLDRYRRDEAAFIDLRERIEWLLRTVKRLRESNPPELVGLRKQIDRTGFSSDRLCERQQALQQTGWPELEGRRLDAALASLGDEFDALGRRASLIDQIQGQFLLLGNRFSVFWGDLRSTIPKVVKGREREAELEVMLGREKKVVCEQTFAVDRLVGDGRLGEANCAVGELVANSDAVCDGLKKMWISSCRELKNSQQNENKERREAEARRLGVTQMVRAFVITGGIVAIMAMVSHVIGVNEEALKIWFDNLPQAFEVFFASLWEAVAPWVCCGFAALVLVWIIKES